MEADVSGFHRAGLIVATGEPFLWSNQTGGHACNHPVAAGRYVPLVVDGLEDWLSEFFAGASGKFRSWCTGDEGERLGEEDADVIDEKLAEFFDYARAPWLLLRLKVDRNKLQESQERAATRGSLSRATGRRRRRSASGARSFARRSTTSFATSDPRSRRGGGWRTSR